MTSIVGLGGEGILRTYGYDEQAKNVIRAALEEGITYFDSARAYAGSEQYYGLSLGRDRERIFLTSKAHDRTKHGALAMLDRTLANMRTDHLDLWQLHDLRTAQELEAIMAPGGAYEAFVEAKQAGKTRFIGLTGHYDPDVLLEALRCLRFDTLLIPVNPAENISAKSFPRNVGAVAKSMGLGVIGMKVLGRGLLAAVADPPSLQSLFDYALSEPVDVIIVGCDTVEQVRKNAAAGHAYAPMADGASRELEQRIASIAGQVLYYRRPDEYAGLHHKVD